jgi:hypothetical protein
MKSCILQEDSFTSKEGVNLRKELVTSCIWNMAVYGAETGTLRNAEQKYLGSYEVRCWRRIARRTNQYAIKRRSVTGFVTCRNCLLKLVIKGKIQRRIEVTGRRWSRRKHVLVERKETRGYWKLKEEALDRTLWRTRFGRGYGPVVRQTAVWKSCAKVKFRSYVMK